MRSGLVLVAVLFSIQVGPKMTTKYIKFLITILTNVAAFEGGAKLELLFNKPASSV
jgi:hypothetical protein